MSIFLRVKRKASETPIEYFETQHSVKRIHWDPLVTKGTKFRYVGSAADKLVQNTLNRHKLLRNTHVYGSRRLLLNLKDESLVVDPSSDAKSITENKIIGCKRTLATKEGYLEHVQSVDSTNVAMDCTRIGTLASVGNKRIASCFEDSVTKLETVDKPRARKIMRIIDVPCLPSLKENDSSSIPVTDNMTITLDSLALDDCLGVNKLTDTCSVRAVNNTTSEPIASLQKVDNVKLANSESPNAEKPSEAEDGYLYDLYRIVSSDRRRAKRRLSYLSGTSHDYATGDSEDDDNEVEFDDEFFRDSGFRVRRPYCRSMRHAVGQIGDGNDEDSSAEDDDRLDDSDDSNSESNWRNDYPEERSVTSSDASSTSSSGSSSDDFDLSDGESSRRRLRQIGTHQYRQSMGAYW